MARGASTLVDLLDTDPDHGLVRLLWQRPTEDPACIRVLAGNGAPLHAATIVEGGRYLASGSADGLVHLWNTADGTLANASSGVGFSIRRLAATTDGKYIIAIGQNRQAVVLSCPELTLEQTLSGHTGPLIAIAVEPDGPRVVIVGRSWIASVWDVSSGSLVHQLSGHKGAVTSTLVGADGTRVVTGSEDGTAIVWDLNSGALVHQLIGHHSAVTAIAIVADNTRVVTGSEDGTAIVWDLNSGALVHQLSGDWGPVTSIVTSAELALVVTATNSGVLAVWDANGGVLKRCLSGHSASVRWISPIDDNAHFTTVSEDGRVISWNGLETIEVHESSSQGLATIETLSLSAARDIALTSSADGFAVVWEVATGTAIRRLTHALHQPCLGWLNAGGDRAITENRDGSAAVWEISSGALLFHLVEEMNASRSTEIFSLEHGGSVLISGESVLLSGPGGAYVIRQVKRGVAVIAGDGRSAMTVAAGRRAIVWSLANGELLYTISPADRVLGLSQNGDLAIIATWDGEIVCLDLKRGERAWALTVPYLSAIAFGDHDKSLLAAGLGGQLVSHSTTGHDSFGSSALGHGMVGIARDAPIAWVAAERSLLVFDLQTGSETIRIDKGMQPLSDLAVSDNGRCAVGALSSGDAFFWDLGGQMSSGRFALPGTSPKLAWVAEDLVLATGGNSVSLYRIPRNRSSL